MSVNMHARITFGSDLAIFNKLAVCLGFNFNVSFVNELLIPIRPEWRSDTNSGVNFKTGKPQKEGESLLPMAIRNKKWMEHTCRDRQECNPKGCRNSQNKWKEQ